MIQITISKFSKTKNQTKKDPLKFKKNQKYKWGGLKSKSFIKQTPQKKQKKYYIGTILPFWHFLALLGFFLPRITPKKNQKMTILTKFGHFGTSWHCSDFFLPPIPPKNPKNDYFGKIWPFWHFLALFWGGVKIAQKKIMLFKYSPLARQDSKNFYTHCFLIISQIILTGTGHSYQRVLGN